ncbi:MAG: glycosyltransferase [Prevotellaceae bacterium]|nr:glycosyltransferase [Prevotellaceae bacterium]
MNFSIVIPVYNRPDEIDELLHSLTAQTDSDFEVVVVEDGSTISCEDVCKKYTDRLNLHYFYKENSGPGDSRNYGARHSSGNYLIILDSDVIVPREYLRNVRTELTDNYCDAFGGADAADTSFSDMQKAVNYAMTSFFTTGGIRGGKKQMERFHPRSFNLGVGKTAFEAIGGFAAMRYGEDIDLSIRLYKAGYSVRLLQNATVYHKRRTDLQQFFKQVKHSGEARIALWQRHPDYPGALKIVHFLPAVFSIGVLLLLVASVFIPLLILPVLLFCLLIFIDSSLKNKSLKIGLLSVVTSFTQLFGYGFGFIKAFVKKFFD